MRRRMHDRSSSGVAMRRRPTSDEAAACPGASALAPRRGRSALGPTYAVLYGRVTPLASGQPTSSMLLFESRQPIGYCALVSLMVRRNHFSFEKTRAAEGI